MDTLRWILLILGLLLVAGLYAYYRWQESSPADGRRSRGRPGGDHDVDSALQDLDDLVIDDPDMDMDVGDGMDLHIGTHGEHGERLPSWDAGPEGVSAPRVRSAPGYADDGTQAGGQQRDQRQEHVQRLQPDEQDERRARVARDAQAARAANASHEGGEVQAPRPPRGDQPHQADQVSRTPQADRGGDQADQADRADRADRAQRDEPGVRAGRERENRGVRQQENSSGGSAAEAARGGGMESDPAWQDAGEKIVVLHVTAGRGYLFTGPLLVDALERTGLQYGMHGIYHWMGSAQSGSTPLFSVANMLEPGTFDLDRAQDMDTPGVAMFMQLPGPFDGLTAFEQMLEVARRLADELEGQLLDGKRCDLTTQAIEHLRSDLREYRRKAQVAARRNQA